MKRATILVLREQGKVLPSIGWQLVRLRRGALFKQTQEISTRHFYQALCFYDIRTTQELHIGPFF